MTINNKIEAIRLYRLATTQKVQPEVIVGANEILIKTVAPEFSLKAAKEFIEAVMELGVKYYEDENERKKAERYNQMLRKHSIEMNNDKE